ncbi:MAG TPA: ribbon-helix-helix protein, CopG family [Thermoanaerobaculia bacterium]|nr:ribbon-helix-helix protein, CopG family [Thermoanaerobaculia bacterium]
MVTRITFTLDKATIRRLQSASERLGKPKSQVIRDAIAVYHEGIGRLSEAERQQQLYVLRDLVPSIPARPLREVEKEIADIRSARRSGGRGSR